MTIKINFAQFLMTHGVAKAKAETVSAAIDGKILKRQPLNGEETALTQLFIGRPSANHVAEQYVAAAVETSHAASSGTSSPGTQVVPSQIKVILLSPKDALGLTQQSNSAATAAGKEQHQGATILTSNFRGSTGVNALADQIAKNA